MELQHFAHEHLLTLCICKEGNDDVVGHGKEVTCDICLEPISGDDSSSSFYSCTQCDFFVHKFCAELPEKMINIFHPAHQLELGFFTYSNLYCDICEEGTRLGQLGYHCYSCEFSVDPTCALRSTFEPEGHEHSFILFKPTIFTCDVCGEESQKFMSNVCTTCRFQVHKKCTSTTFPHTLKQKAHIHQLTLTYSFQLDSVDQPCKICFRKLKSELCVYYCSICHYIAHISCATSEYFKEPELVPEMAALKMMEEDDDDENQEHKQNNNPEEVMIMSTHLSKEDKIIHVSHEHCLILSSNDDDDETRRDEICDGCVRPVGIVPFYACAEQEEQCNFFLHKHCFELPNKIVHPLHPLHLLTLHAEIPASMMSERQRNDLGIVSCRGCNRDCNGFIYACDNCEDFFLDVTCSLYTDTIQDERHLCHLDLILGKENRECNACGLQGEAKYGCEECHFNLGLGCASLKDTTHECQCRLYNCDIRPLKLTYKVEDDSGEYYCDVCEERRGEDHWFYYCEDCKFASHLNCIHENMSIKFGRSYQFEKRLHPHSLTMLRKATGNSTCITCGEPCGTMPVLECAECDIRMHTLDTCLVKDYSSSDD